MFEENEKADKLYVLVSGSVGMFKRIAPDKELLLVTFDVESKFPWFGESALVAYITGDKSKGFRSAAGFTLQETVLLSCNVKKAGRLIEVLPDFAKLVNMGSSARKTINKALHDVK